MSENFTWREQLKTNFKINLLFSILWANPQGVTRAQMSQISGDDLKTLSKTETFENVPFSVWTDENEGFSFLKLNADVKSVKYCRFHQRLWAF